MPREGVFAKVLRGGKLQAGDELRYVPRTIRGLIITLSDRASKGEYKDVSGPLLEKKLNKHIQSIGWKPENRLVVIPDDIDMLQDLVVAAVNEALRRAQQMVSDDMGKITGGMNIPGMGNISG